MGTVVIIGESWGSLGKLVHTFDPKLNRSFDSEDLQLEEGSGPRSLGLEVADSSNFRFFGPKLSTPSPHP